MRYQGFFPRAWYSRMHLVLCVEQRQPDGDPEVVLIIMDEPTFTGCVVPTRLLGALEAEQTEKGKDRAQ